jgi:hypothetical protein
MFSGVIRRGHEATLKVTMLRTKIPQRALATQA